MPPTTANPTNYHQPHQLPQPHQKKLAFTAAEANKSKLRDFCWITIILALSIPAAPTTANDHWLTLDTKQLCCHQDWQITLVGSRPTHAEESQYAPIVGEAPAVADAKDKAHSFVLGCKELIVAVDHKSQLKIFGEYSHWMRYTNSVNTEFVISHPLFMHLR